MMRCTVKCYRGKAWFDRLRLFASTSCRRIWDQIPPGPARDAVEAAEQYAAGRITLNELYKAQGHAWGVVDAASKVPGSDSRIHGSLVETVALAAWACTLPAERPALEATAYVIAVAHNRWSLHASSDEKDRAFDAEMAELVALLRLTVGNPFPHVSQG
jgi:hypothetical protein